MDLLFHQLSVLPLQDCRRALGWPCIAGGCYWGYGRVFLPVVGIEGRLSCFGHIAFGGLACMGLGSIEFIKALILNTLTPQQPVQRYDSLHEGFKPSCLFQFSGIAWRGTSRPFISRFIFLALL